MISSLNWLSEMTFRATSRKKRGERKLFLRQTASFLGVDTLSKLEDNERKASKEQILKLTEFFETTDNELLNIWLANKISKTVSNEMQDEVALKHALKNIKKK